MKILVISLAGIGDTILATPLIHELRANFPDARIDALVRWPGARDILAGSPWLNNVYQKDLAQEGRLKSLRFLHGLRQTGYDVSINTHPQSRREYRVVARIIGARRRISHRYECSGLVDRMLVNETLPQDYQKNSVDMNLDVLPLLGAKPLVPRHELEVFLTDAEQSGADSFLAA